MSIEEPEGEADMDIGKSVENPSASSFARPEDKIIEEGGNIIIDRPAGVQVRHKQGDENRVVVSRLFKKPDQVTSEISISLYNGTMMVNELDPDGKAVPNTKQTEDIPGVIEDPLKNIPKKHNSQMTREASQISIENLVEFSEQIQRGLENGLSLGNIKDELSEELTPEEKLQYFPDNESQN